MPPQVERMDAHPDAQQMRDERAVPFDVALRVLAEAVLKQQNGARMRRVPRVASNAGADVPVAVVDAGAQGVRFSGASPR